MVQREKIDKIIQKLDKTSRISQRIEKDIDDVKKTVMDAPTGLIESFKKYTNPQANLDQLLNFYSIFLKTGESINIDLKELEKLSNINKSTSDLENEDSCISKMGSLKISSNASNTKASKNSSTPSVVNSEISVNIAAIEDSFEKEKKNIEIYFKVKNKITDLEPYKDINIVKKFIKDSLAKTNKIIQPLRTKFFEYLPIIIKSIEDGSIRKVIPIQTASYFLLESDEKNFIEKYSLIMLKTYSHKNLETDIFIQKLKNVGKCFGKIENVNDHLLDETKRKMVNDLLRQYLFVELKDILAKTLLSFENKYKPENIIFTCEIYLIITKRELVRTFSDFKEEVLGIINNDMLKFLDSIENEEKPIKNFRNEDWLLIVYKLMNLFKNNEILEHDFFSLYSDNFDFGNHNQMNNFLGALTFEKIFALSDLLKGIQKNIYLLNNLHMIDLFFKEYKGRKIANFFEKYMREIIEMWRLECEKRKHDKIKGQRFLDINLDIQRDYYLPDELRDYLIEKISEIVENFVRTNGYKNGREVLNVKINGLFTGE